MPHAATLLPVPSKPEPAPTVPQSAQHGLLRPSPSPGSQHGLHVPVPLQGRLGGPPRAAGSSLGDGEPESAVGPDARPCCLTGPGRSASPVVPLVAGQRVADYENALAAPQRSSLRPSLDLDLDLEGTTPPRPSEHGVRLTDLPNEILTQILSHLHSHGAVALVSRRFYGLITTPYAWRAAFLRNFPGHTALASPYSADNALDDNSDAVKAESRRFTRLSALASWRSEYLLRTRLLRSVGRGKPAAPSNSAAASSRTPQPGKRSSAVLTYNTRLPWPVTKLHALFSGGRKAMVMHGTSALGVGTVSDPYTGKVEKTGLDPSFSFAQLGEMFPNLQPYGVGDDGPAAVPNVLDLSQPYGLLSGEGFPGGRVFFRAAGDVQGRYLGHDAAITDTTPAMPQVPKLTEAVSSVWIAKSSSVPSTTCGMIGMLAGSTLGLVTAFALGIDFSGPRYAPGDTTSCWLVSPGVPIIDIKVDDNYSPRRRSMGRVWAVVLNALGEVFFLIDTPTPPQKINRQRLIEEAWHTGSSACWNLIESTRRQARPDNLDENVFGLANDLASPDDAMHPTGEQMVARVREAERHLRRPPADFRDVYQGWDMRRRLQVDFASDGESVFVISCGLISGTLPGICKYLKLRQDIDGSPATRDVPSPAEQPAAVHASSVFGGDAHQLKGGGSAVRGVEHGISLPGTGNPPIPTAPYKSDVDPGWRVATLVLPTEHAHCITATCVDLSIFATTTSFEDPLHMADKHDARSNRPADMPASRHAAGEIPGRRSRLMAVGNSSGEIMVWDMRDGADTIQPVRMIQTESPMVSSLALSSLYLVHGGSDGLVQAWDPLASSLEPLRTLSARASGRVPRHMVNMNPALQNADFCSVGDIFLDPDPAVLRGVSSVGTFVRFWSYSSSGHLLDRKRRNRHLDASRVAASRRLAATVSSHIAAEEAELRHEKADRAREDARLRRRFGVGMGELTEDEAIRYTQMISEESFRLDEQRRTLSASDTGSSADGGETSSLEGGSLSSNDALEPRGLTGGESPSSASLPPLPETADGDAEFEEQIQRALRLSLLEGVGNTSSPAQDSMSPPAQDSHSSPRAVSSDVDELSPFLEFRIREAKPKNKKKTGKELPPSSSSPAASTARTLAWKRPHAGGSGSQGHPRLVLEVSNDAVSGLGSMAMPSSARSNPAATAEDGIDEELALALRLSLEEEQARLRLSANPFASDNNGHDGDVAPDSGVGLVMFGDDEFPALETGGKGKGKWV